MDPKKEDPGYYDISEILDCQDENTVEIDYLCDGTERTIDLSQIANPTYANVTLTSGGYSMSSGTGIVYSPTATSWSPTGTSTGTIRAKDLVLDGVSLKELLEERLNLMVPNPELEKEWDQLRELGDQYRKLEADLKEKGRIWQALKKK